MEAVESSVDIYVLGCPSRALHNFVFEELSLYPHLLLSMAVFRWLEQIPCGSVFMCMMGTVGIALARLTCLLLCSSQQISHRQGSSWR